MGGTLKREPIDFHYIPAELRWVDELLVNWARWQHGGLGLSTSPGFELYRPDNYERTPRKAIDVLSAMRVQESIKRLDERHRKALQWSYIQPTNPVRRARELKVSTRGLHELVIEAMRILAGVLTPEGECVVKCANA